MVITNAIFSDTSNNRTQSSADKLGHPIKFTEKMDGIWVYRFASHPWFAYWAIILCTEEEF